MEKIYYKFINKKKKNSIIRIYGTSEVLGLLNSKNISQYFIDGTYNVLPNENFSNVLLILVGYNYIKNIYSMFMCFIK